MNGNHRGRTRGKKKKGEEKKENAVFPSPLTLSGNKSTLLLPLRVISLLHRASSIDKGEVKGKDSEKDEEEERHVIDVSITRFVDAVADR